MAWPPELVEARPYSSGPLSNWDPVIMSAFPARGGSMLVDNPGISLHTALFAPPALQAAYRKAGGNGIVMRRIPGLAEALGIDPDSQTSLQVVPGALGPELAEVTAGVVSSIAKAPVRRGRR